MASSKEVTGCNDCPFYYYSWDDAHDTTSECRHPNSPIYDGFDNEQVKRKSPNPITPDWCPLKKEDILISIKK